MCPGRTENKWRWTQSRANFSRPPNSLLTGKFTGKLHVSAEAAGYKSPPESVLAVKTGFSRPIETGNDQGVNRIEIPYSWILGEMSAPTSWSRTRLRDLVKSIILRNASGFDGTRDTDDDASLGALKGQQMLHVRLMTILGRARKRPRPFCPSRRDLLRGRFRSSCDGAPGVSGRLSSMTCPDMPRRLELGAVLTVTCPGEGRQPTKGR